MDTGRRKRSRVNLWSGQGDAGPTSGIGRRLALWAAVGAVSWGTWGCVRRTLTITTEPPHARVFLNDHEVGVSTVQTDFTWYGDYDVVIRKEGYETLHTRWKVEPPWYQFIPIDFLTEVLWPGQLHDQRSKHFELSPSQTPDAETLVERAREVRKRALDPRK